MRKKGKQKKWKEAEKDIEKNSLSVCQRSPVAAAADVTCNCATVDRCVLILDDCSLQAPSIRSPRSISLSLYESSLG